MGSMMENPRINKAGNGREHIRLTMDSLSQNEEFARVVAAVFMSRLNPTLEEIDDVKTAVSEAVTNAVIHGYGSRGGVIGMDITADTDGSILTVCIEDQGVGIPDVKTAMEPSGMGFSFMEAFMDEVEVQSEPGKGTLVSMKKFIGR